MPGAEFPDGTGMLSGPMAAELLEDAPCGIAVSDPSGRLTYINTTLRSWCGRGPAEIETLGGLFTLPGKMFYDTHMVPMLRLQGYVREISCQLRTLDEPCPVVVSGVARHNADGKLIRCDYTLFNARERHGYETALRRARREAEELASIVRNAGNAILRINANGSIGSWNRGANELFELAEDIALGQQIETLVQLPDQEGWFAEGRELLLQGGQHELLFETIDVHEADLEISLTLAPIEPGSAAERDVVVSLRDISERKRAERYLAAMAREMNSRVSAMLEVVSAMARDSLPAEIGRDFTGRITALARTHTMLSSNHWTQIDLHSILNFALAEAGGPERFRFAGPAIRLTPQQATGLSIGLHELVANALTHGALSRPLGHVLVEYEREAGPEFGLLRINWTERGGPTVTAPQRAGFGARLLDTVLVRDCGARVVYDFPREGFTCTIELPLAKGL